MEKHMAVAHIGVTDEEKDTRRFLMNLSFKNVRQINTAKFACLLNEKAYDNYSVEPVKKDEFMTAIGKYLELSDEEQLKFLKQCCTFVIDEDEHNCISFKIPKQRDYIRNIEEELENERELQILESKLKYCKNHLEKQKITREIQSIKMFNSKKRGGKPSNKKKR